MNLMTNARLLAVALMIVMCGTVASADDNTGSGSTSTTTYRSVADLPGIDITEANTTEGHDASGDLAAGSRPGGNNPTVQQRESIYLLYNVGQDKFLYSGALYGMQAVLSRTGHYIWLEKGDGTATWNDVSSSDNFQKYRLHMNVTTANQTGNNSGYLDYAVESTSKETGFYVNGGWGTSNNYKDFIFARVLSANGHDYSNQYVYRMAVAQDANARRNLAWAANATTSDNRLTSMWYADNDTLLENALWKLIPLSQYYELSKAQAKDLTKPVDYAFALQDPGFHVNNNYLSGWHLEKGTSSGFRFGTLYEWKTASQMNAIEYFPNGDTSGSGNNHYDGNYERDYGNDFFAYTYNSDADALYQDVTVHNNGWYVVTCQGFSTLNTTSESRVNLFVGAVKDGSLDESTVRSQPLNPISWADASAMFGSYSGKKDGRDGHAIGVAFANGTYPNQVMFQVKGLDENDKNGTTVRLGIRISDANNSGSSAKVLTRATPDGSATNITAVDAFDVSFTGTAPTLMLDENDFQLDTLQNTTADFTNVTLELKRTFTVDKWNTIILPVRLNKQQVLNTFGSDTKVARLRSLTNSSIVFYTDEPQNDDDVMIEAYVPYIIKPSKNAPENNGDEDSWQMASSSSFTSPTTKHVAGNHYSFTFVTFKQSTLNNENNNVIWNSDGSTEWLSGFTGNGHTGSVDNTTMTAYGALAKTYDNEKKYSENGSIRSDLSGAYYMNKGEMYHVPANGQYGVKGFRVYFKTQTTTAQARPNFYVDNNLIINGDEPTGISAINAWKEDAGVKTSAAKSAGIYNLNGQKLSDRADTSSLPCGVYIINGEKVVVR